jgi:hypothetical protein
MPWQRFSQSVSELRDWLGLSLPSSHRARQSDMRWRRSEDMVTAQAPESASNAITVQQSTNREARRIDKS